MPKTISHRDHEADNENTEIFFKTRINLSLFPWFPAKGSERFNCFKYLNNSTTRVYHYISIPNHFLNLFSSLTEWKIFNPRRFSNSSRGPMISISLDRRQAAFDLYAESTCKQSFRFDPPTICLICKNLLYPENSSNPWGISSQLYGMSSQFAADGGAIVLCSYYSDRMQKSPIEWFLSFEVH